MQPGGVFLEYTYIHTYISLSLSLSLGKGSPSVPGDRRSRLAPPFLPHHLRLLLRLASQQLFLNYQTPSSTAPRGARLIRRVILPLTMRKKKNFFRKPVAVKNQRQQQQPSVDPITGKKIPKSFVFSRGKLPGPLRQLQMDLRKLMLPYTALNLKEKKRNNLKDFLNVAGPMGVTHFLILSKTATASYLRVATTPQGPTLTFKINEYSLAADIAQSQLRPRYPKDLFKNSALIVLSGFVSGDLPLQLTTNMFQNIFPTIDVKTVKLSSCQRIVLLNYNKERKLIDFRHYSIRLQPVGVSRRIRKFVQNHQVPDLRNLHDVSDFITKAGYGSESEADDEAATVTLASDLGRVNRASTKSAVKLQEVGPRMTLKLIKVEKGLCSGEVLFSEYGE
ncbi:peter Pan-like protein isoform X2 [Prosopis cineraria]|uniref:peter Pan-like protein isoform X2 n=1 Tax=Prosopis cineraria TaxID=364024 RepID=UPI00240EACCB|nr:peter Pan-like protein isoform X2 [Prosopis cineraria]